MSQLLQLLSEFPGILLGNSRTSSASEVVAVEETMQPTSNRPDHFAGHSL